MVKEAVSEVEKLFDFGGSKVQLIIEVLALVQRILAEFDDEPKEKEKVSE